MLDRPDSDLLCTVKNKDVFVAHIEDITIDMRLR